MKPRWYVLEPLPGSVGDTVREMALRVPGVHKARGGKRLLVPEHALAVVQGLAQAHAAAVFPVKESPRPGGLDVPGAAQAAAGAFDPPGTLREGVAEWLTEYQREIAGIARQTRGGLLMLWSAGCLAGDAEIVVNRGGCARRMKLRDLVHKFNGGATRVLPPGASEVRVHVWRQEFPTRVQSRDPETGTLRLNEVVAAVASGVKQTFTVLLRDGRSLRATADHRMLTARGWVAVGDLKADDEIWVEAGQATGVIPKKNYYPTQAGMHHHPYAGRSLRHRVDRPGPTRIARVAKHRVAMEAKLSGLTYEMFVRRVRAGDLAGLCFLDPKVFAVHHIDENTENYAIENLCVQTHTEHWREHALGGTWKHVAYKTALVPVASVTPFGEEETFDLTMAEPLNNFVANGMVVHNSGKTLGATVAAEAAPAGGLNVVVTLAGHKRFWRSEIERLCTRRAGVIDGEGQAGWDAAMAAGDGELDHAAPEYLILSWEILDAHVERLVNVPIGWLILDESHRTADPPKGAWWKRVEARVGAAQGLAPAEVPVEVSDTSPADSGKPKRARKGVWSEAALTVASRAARVIELSATPMPKCPRDLYVQMEMLAPGALGGFNAFAKRYCDAHSEDVPNVGPVWMTDGASNTAELKARLRFHTHVVAKARSHAALPPLRRTVHYIPAGELLADRMAKAERARLEGDGSAKSRYEAQLMAAARRKRPFVLGLLEAALTSGKKVVVLTGRHADVEELAEEVQRRFAKVSGLWVRGVHGGNTTGEERELAVGLRRADGTWTPDSYMAQPGPACLIATADTLGTGTNLQDTDDLILAMLPYTPGMVTQRENRVHRLGGKRRPNVHYPVAEGTIEEQIAERLLERLPACSDINETGELEDLREKLSGDDLDDAAFARGLFATLVGNRFDSEEIVQLALAGTE